MRIGLSVAAFPANMTIPQGLKLAKRSGFDCVELTISEAGYLTPESDEQAVEFLRRAIENMSLYAGSVVAHVLADMPESDFGMAAERCVEICAGVGAGTLVLPCVGPAGEMESLVAQSQRHGVELCVEYADGVPLAGGVGVCVDTGLMLEPSALDLLIDKLGNRVKLVRARDYRVLASEEVECVNLLEGNVNWKQVRRALLDIDYRGDVIAMVPGYRQYSELGIKHCGEIMKRVFGAPSAARGGEA